MVLNKSENMRLSSLATMLSQLNFHIRSSETSETQLSAVKCIFIHVLEAQPTALIPFSPRHDPFFP